MQEFQEQLRKWGQLSPDELKCKYNAYVNYDTQNGIPFSHLVEMRHNNYISQEIYNYITKKS